METKENHDHIHKNRTSERLLLSIFLNALITLVEITGGIFSNSLALISDAIHNLGDTLALVLAWLANKVSGRRPDARRTFGYQRVEILSAFINTSVLTAISIYLIYVAIMRFLHPEQVKAGLMLIIAVIGLIANLVSMIFLHHDSKYRLNIKAAYLHLLGDTFSSLAVVAGALIIYFVHITWVDPALTLLISIIIIIQAYQVLRKSIDILMQSTPSRIDLAEIKNAIEALPLVGNIHHVHCWQLQDHDVLFEAHIEALKDMTLSESNHLREEIESLLQKRFQITHATLQIEFENCDDKAMIKQPNQ